MRLFIAIQFDDEMLNALSDLQDDLRAIAVRFYDCNESIADALGTREERYDIH